MGSKNVKIGFRTIGVENGLGKVSLCNRREDPWNLCLALEMARVIWVGPFAEATEGPTIGDHVSPDIAQTAVMIAQVFGSQGKFWQELHTA